MVSIFIDPFRSIAGFLVIIVVTFKENEDFTAALRQSGWKKISFLRFLLRLVEATPSVCLNNIPTFPSSFVWISHFQRAFPPSWGGSVAWSRIAKQSAKYVWFTVDLHTEHNRVSPWPWNISQGYSIFSALNYTAGWFFPIGLSGREYVLINFLCNKSSIINDIKMDWIQINKCR